MSETSGEAESKIQWRSFEVRVGENGREAGRKGVVRACTEARGLEKEVR